MKFDTDIKLSIIVTKQLEVWKHRNDFEVFYNEMIKLCSYNVDNKNNVFFKDFEPEDTTLLLIILDVVLRCAGILL